MLQWLVTQRFTSDVAKVYSDYILGNVIVHVSNNKLQENFFHNF